MELAMTVKQVPPELVDSVIKFTDPTDFCMLASLLRKPGCPLHTLYHPLQSTSPTHILLGNFFVLSSPSKVCCEILISNKLFMKLVDLI